jgi:signal transduction histidine kinase
MLIIKYFNDAYESYINGIETHIYINKFIENCINIINPNKISYYSLSNNSFINSRELKFNKTIVGYFTVTFNLTLSQEEESNYHLFLTYLSLLIYNSKNYIINNDNSLSLMKSIFNSISVNILITNDNLLIIYLNESAKIFLKNINNLNNNYINVSILNFLPHLQSLITNKFMKNKKIKLNIDNYKICIIINSIEYLNTKYNIFTFNIIDKDISNNSNTSNSIAMLSHELRNPLQTINLASALLTKKITDNNQQINNQQLDNQQLDNQQLNNQQLNKYIKMISQSSNEMKKIINDILDLNKIISNEMNLNIENININTFIESIVSEITDIYINNSHNINVNINENVPTYIFTDEIRLKQILINLITNSIKYSKKSQKNNIKINITYLESNIYFEIEDTGIGIKEESISQLFEYFGQTIESSERSDSNGLGLFISQQLAHLLGGEITIQSKYGEGSKFTLIHPIKLGYTFNINNIFNPIINLNNNILIVDDIENNAILLKSILQNISLKYNCNLTIDIALNGEQSINLCKINKYDLIFMDINMGNIDGYTATRIIKDNGYKNIVIATTGNENTQLVKNNYVYFDNILIKPFDDTNILTILTKYN